MAEMEKGLCSTPTFQGSYLPPQIELGVMLPIFGKPWLSTFQWFLRIAIPMFLEKVMAIFVTVREAEKLRRTTSAGPAPTPAQIWQ